MESSGSRRRGKFCFCGLPALLSKSGTIRNLGCKFWRCSRWKSRNCGFFMWATTEDEILFGSHFGGDFQFDGADLGENSVAAASSSSVRTQGGISSCNLGQHEIDGFLAVKFMICCLIVGILLGFVLNRL